VRRLVLAFAPIVVLVGLVWLFMANINRDPNYVPSVMLEKPVPVFDLKPVDGLDRPGFDSAALKGQVTLVNVFASWCIPCREEHPLLMELSKTGVPIYGINQKDAPENVRAFLESLGNPYEKIGADSNGRVSIDWGVYGVPESFVVNADGIITYKHTGPITAQSLKDSVLPAIKAAAKQ
jgi:cytochrome c biogenesis protein CcmG, thiol:disulfide interchange protein DsbE